MREKLEVAKKIRLSRKKFSRNPMHISLVSKCYRAYVFQCVIKNHQTFTLYFGSHYMQGIWKRLSDWVQYVLDYIYRFYLIHFTPNNDKTLKRYELIHFELSKPVHFKSADSVDEFFLEYYLENMGFKIAHERLTLLSTTYEIQKV